MPFFLAHDAKLQTIEYLENQILVHADFKVTDIQTQELFFSLLNSVFFTSLAKGQNQPTSCTKGSIWSVT